MNRVRNILSSVLCLTAIGSFGETYQATDADSLVEALGKAVDGDVIECAAGGYSLTAEIVVTKGVTLRGADRLSGAAIDIGCYEFDESEPAVSPSASMARRAIPCSAIRRAATGVCAGTLRSLTRAGTSTSRKRRRRTSSVVRAASRASRTSAATSSPAAA